MKMKIVALDDEPGALKVLVNAIRGAEPEAEIFAFSKAVEAVNCCGHEEIDVAFLDINIPGSSGLDVAKTMKILRPDMNIIFTTGYSEYALEAFQLHASGYLTKPISKKEVRKELDNLRIRPEPAELSDNAFPRVFIKTFGNFDVFVNDELVTFNRALSKEVLAYLVDRKGSSVNRKELAANMFEDYEYTRSTQSYITQIMKNLQDVLRGHGVEALLVTGYNSYSVDVSKFTCDAYDYAKGIPEAVKAFQGEYMTQYSWAEYTLGQMQS